MKQREANTFFHLTISLIFRYIDIKKAQTAFYLAREATKLYISIDVISNDIHLASTVSYTAAGCNPIRERFPQERAMEVYTGQQLTVSKKQDHHEHQRCREHNVRGQKRCV